jgi:DNA-binding response OmpR family regulator
MKILIIEDIEFRQNLIKDLMGVSDADWSQRAEEGLDLLSKNKYDLVFLDHDIIGAKSGSYLTQRWYEQRKEFATQKPLVIIHSMNEEGAIKMENHLKGVSEMTEKVPFRLIVQKKVDLQLVVAEMLQR